MANHFYGFNGYESVFNNTWMDDSQTDGYRSRMFYRFQRNQFRSKNDFDGKLAGEHFRWSAGFAFQNFDISSVDIEKLNKGKKDQLRSIEEMPGLFERYQTLTIIPADEAKGGWVNTLRAGMIWDSRDNRPNPMKGLWTEAGFEFAPGFMNKDISFTRFYITHRQYFTIIERDLAFAYRLGYQSTIGGHTPFYYQSQLITSRLTGATSEALGGASSMRGVMRNRVMGDGFIYGNLELRWKPIHFTFLKQPAYIGLNGFYDFGLITNMVNMPSDLQGRFISSFPLEQFSDYFNPGGEKLHQSAGISIMPVWHEDFAIAIDIGKSFNPQDGNIGFSIGVDYLF
jgi:outer membrane protein assembly factor BamA